MLDADLAFQLLGYNHLAEKLGTRNLNLSKIPFEVQKYPDNLKVKSIKVPTIFTKPHLLVSVAKIKTHRLCDFTATLKNVYGCNPERYKAKYHTNLHENIVDFASVFRPHLSFIDGIVAMEGNGPTEGTPVRLDSILGGTDPVAIDHLVGCIMRLNPDKVRYLTLARKRGLGTTRYQTIGVDPEEISMQFVPSKPVAERMFEKIKPLVELARLK